MPSDSQAVPGFVDLQVNGYLGVDFSSPELSETAFTRACDALLSRGTAAFLATLITSPLETYARTLPMIARVMRRPAYRGRLLGVHLEGPFISPQPGAVGAHDPRWVLPPDPAVLSQLLRWGEGTIRLLTLAAELPGAAVLAQHAREQGLSVAIGHSMFTPGDLDALAEAGATALTHLGNGLPNLLPRHENPIWAGLADDRYTATLIADGHHLPDAILKGMLRCKGAQRVVIVSDAAPVAGLPPGEYRVLGNRAVLEPSGLLHNPDKACLVGSSATLFECMNHVASRGWLNLDEMIAVAHTNPLRLIRLGPDAVAPDSGVVYRPDLGRFVLSRAA